MTDENPNNPILNHVEPSRRGFMKTVLAGAAFAAPVIATFSIEGLGVDTAYGQVSSSALSSASGSRGPCLPDLGYVGPAVFRAYVLDVSGSTRVNGELTIALNDEGKSADVRLDLVKDADVSSAYLTINGITAATLRLRADDNFGHVHYEGRLTAGDLQGVCDFDSLLQAMASQTVAAVVTGTYSYASFDAQGTIFSAGGPTIQTHR